MRKPPSQQENVFDSTRVGLVDNWQKSALVVYKDRKKIKHSFERRAKSSSQHTTSK